MTTNTAGRSFINMGGSRTIINEGHITGKYSFWVTRSSRGPTFARCRLCQKDINIGSMGGLALKRHADSVRHQQIEDAAKSTNTVYHNNSF